MGTFSSGSMHNSGTPGQALTGGTTYTFELQNRDGQYPLRGASYLVLDGNGVATQQAGGAVTFIGPLEPGIRLPLSNSPISCDANQTATIGVIGGAQGGGAILSLTSTGWNEVLGSGTGKITHATVTTTTGSNFLEGDTITIPQGTPGIQGLGFTNADKAAIFDIFPDYISGLPQNTTITGKFAGFLNSINQSSLVTGSLGFAIEIADSGSIGGAFEFTPITTMPLNSYAIRSTGNFELTIAP